MKQNPVFTNTSSNPSAPVPSIPSAFVPGKDLDSQLNDFRRKYEIDFKYHNYFKRLVEYDNILVCDDSSSMNDLADPDANTNMTRWQELKLAVRIVLDLHEVLQISCSVYFLNRGYLKNVHNFQEIATYFDAPPSGGTNTVATFALMEREEGISNNQEIRKKLIHLFTDGHPTDSNGMENFPAFRTWLMQRNQPSRTFYSIIICSDEENVERLYRPLEYRMGSFGKGGIDGVDVTMDYRGERIEIRRVNSTMPFSYGDYIAKVVIGAFDPTIHNIDMEVGCSCVIN